MVERRDIEQRSAQGIADLLTMAFDKYCAPADGVRTIGASSLQADGMRRAEALKPLYCRRATITDSINDSSPNDRVVALGAGRDDRGRHAAGFFEPRDVAPRFGRQLVVRR